MQRYISDNISAEENACNCGECTRYSADAELVRIIELLRWWARTGLNPEAVINFTSFYRCRAHNNRSKKEKNRFGVYGAGSNDNSWHLVGGACDIWIPGVTVDQIYAYLRTNYPNRLGIGLYDWGIHIDVRSTRADWDERTTAVAA